jgi:hypothetical protein
VTSFTALNGMFNTVVALTQNGIDMPPSKAMIDTWENGCKEYSATVVAWKAMQGVDLAAFNTLLTKSNQKTLHVVPTALTAPVSCTFVPPAAPAGK